MRRHEVVDRVWSGHAVSFALLTQRGHQFIAYYDSERRLTVAGRALGSETLDEREVSRRRYRLGQPQLPTART